MMKRSEEERGLSRQEGRKKKGKEKERGRSADLGGVGGGFGNVLGLRRKGSG